MTPSRSTATIGGVIGLVVGLAGPRGSIAAAATPTAAADRAGAEVVECVALQVNDEIVTLSELRERKKAILDEIYRAHFSEEELQQRLQGARAELIPAVLEERLLLQKARDLGLRVGKEDVDRIVRSIMEQNKMADEAALVRLLEAEGMTLEELRSNIERRSLMEKLKQFEIASKVVVPEEEAKRYYETHREEFREAERVRLREIVLVSEGRSEEQVRAEIDEIAKLIRNGSDFAELATLFSQAPSAEHGGDLGLQTTAELSGEIAAAVASLQPGEVSAPIASRFGFHILQLVERKPVSFRSFEEARDAITAHVQGEQFEARVDAYVAELKSKAFVRDNPDCYAGVLGAEPAPPPSPAGPAKATIDPDASPERATEPAGDADESSSEGPAEGPAGAPRPRP